MELLDYKETAALLRCSPGTLRKYVMNRVVPHVKPFGPNGRVFFLKDEIEKFIDGKKVNYGKDEYV